MLGTNAPQITINDLAVNPRSGNVYLAVSRGRGPEAAPLLVRLMLGHDPQDLVLGHSQPGTQTRNFVIWYDGAVIRSLPGGLIRI